MNVSAVVVPTASLLMLGVLFTCNISSTLAEPCENNGHAVLGGGKLVLKQSNRCIITENNNFPTTSNGVCGTNSVLENGACVPCPPGTVAQNGFCVPTTGTAPVANAGTSQTATSGTTVFLDGSGSFATTSGATIVSYSWVQSPGIQPVTLTGANTATPSFVAPTVVNQTPLVFSLTVTDSLGQVSTPSSVTVTVFPSP